MPYIALPLTLSGVSSRFSGLPISLNSETGFSAGSFGGSMRLASSIRSPYASLRLPLASLDFAVVGTARRRLDFPAARCGFDEHRANARAGFAQRRPERADRIRIAGDLDSEDRIAVQLVVRWRVLDRNLGPVRIELLGEDHRDRRVHALAHFDLRHDQRHRALSIDTDECIRRERRRRISRRLRLRTACENRTAVHHPSRRRRS